MTRQEAILEAMRRANPDRDGDLMQKLREIDPGAAASVERATEALRIQQAQRR